jgi:hypothetical protein
LSFFELFEPQNHNFSKKVQFFLTLAEKFQKKNLNFFELFEPEAASCKPFHEVIKHGKIDTRKYE